MKSVRRFMIADHRCRVCRVIPFSFCQYLYIDINKKQIWLEWLLPYMTLIPTQFDDCEKKVLLLTD